MKFRGGIEYASKFRNGIEYTSVFRNGVEYGESGSPQPSPTRLVRINLSNEFGEDGPTGWNNAKPNGTQVQQAEGYLMSGLLDSDGEATPFSFVNLTAFDGALNNISGTYGEPNGIYPHTVVNSGWNFVRDRGDTFRIGGLDNAKKYNIYLGSFQLDSEDYSVTFTIDSQTVGKPNYDTYGDEIDVEPISNYLVGIMDISPTSGNIDIICNAVGFFQGKVGAILIYEIGDTPPEPPEDLGKVNLTIEMSDASSAGATIPPLKYNKHGSVIMDFDDSTLSAIDLWDNKLKSTFYTDGCGNDIPYTFGVAVNGRFQFDNELVGGAIGAARDSMSFAQQRAMIDAGNDIMNHSYYHDPDGNQTGVPRWGNGNNPPLNVQQLHDLILQESNYVMNAGVVPNSDAGYQTAFNNIGDYITGSSQGTYDGYPVWDQFHWPKRMSLLATNWSFIVQHRDFAVSGWHNGNEAWGRTDDLINWMSTNPNDQGVIALGTHGMTGTEQTNFIDWIDDLKARGGDSVSFMSLREFWEYQYIKNNILKTESIDGNNLKVEIDYSVLDNKKISWFDLSFIVSGSGTINGVQCDDNRFSVSFNPTTRIVNIKYRKTVWEQESITFSTDAKRLIGCCGVHEDYEHGFDEEAFGTARLFSDRAWFEGDVPGNELIFQASRGGWYFDDAYGDFKSKDVELVVTLQKLAIGDPVQVSNKPLNNPLDDPEDPESYSKCADFFKQFAMRYGRISYPTNELRSDDKLSGLDLVNVLEIDNEPDRNWLGPDAYYEPEEFAALLSSCYDAIKEADPSMKVSMGGLADGWAIWYLDRMMTWFKANRGDGKFAADILAFHVYAFNNSIDWSNPPYPLPKDAETPEAALFYDKGRLWRNWANNNAPHCKIYCGEFGWDTNEDSPLRPRHIEVDDNYELQSRYILRGTLELVAGGVDRSQIFTIVDPGQDYDDTQHATNGVISRTLGFTPKLSFTSVKGMFDELSGFSFKRIVRRDSVHILEFDNGSETIHAAWLPTATNDSQQVEIGSQTVTVTENPIFVSV